MTRFVISTRGEAREQYVVEAENEDEARAMFERGELPKAAVCEVYDSEIASVDRIGE